jgi:hypothetical protein
MNQKNLRRVLIFFAVQIVKDLRTRERTDRRVVSIICSERVFQLDADLLDTTKRYRRRQLRIKSIVHRFYSPYGDPMPVAPEKASRAGINYQAKDALQIDRPHI